MYGTATARHLIAVNLPFVKLLAQPTKDACHYILTSRMKEKLIKISKMCVALYMQSVHTVQKYTTLLTEERQKASRLLGDLVIDRFPKLRPSYI